MAPGWSPPSPGIRARASVTDTLSAGAYLPEATIVSGVPAHPLPSPKPDPTATVVRRKPLPASSPVIAARSRRSGPSLSVSSSSSLYSTRSLSQADPPARASPLQSPASHYSHSRNSSVANSLSSFVSNSAAQSSVRGEPSLFARRTIDKTDRFPRSSPLKTPLRIDTSASTVNVDGDDDSDDSDDDITNLYKSQFTNGTPIHSRLVSEPFIPVLPSPINYKRATTMALHPPTNRPPPLHIDSNARSMSSGGNDPRQPKTPGSKISSFFGWRAATSPGAESSSTEISDGGRSPLPSPMPPSIPSTSFSITPSTSIPFDPTARPNVGYPVRNGSLSSAGILESSSSALVAELENELREISSELAGSIRREMELEDLVERLQSEMPSEAPNRRTSDYFSDSGSSSIRYAYESAGRIEDIEKYKRAAEQERAQLRAELGQRLQEERTRRTASESHVQILEAQVAQLRRERTEHSDLASKTRELESALEGTRRKLAEERQIKDNFEDLLTAMRVELEQLRTERDLLREGQPLSDPAEVQRLKEEIEALKIENAALSQLQGSRFASIAEEEGPVKRNSAFGLSRSNSLARMPRKSSSRSGSLSRSNSVSAKDRATPPQESLADRVEGAEAQRDALHGALKRLLDRQAYEARQTEKRIRAMELELARAQEAGSPRKLGYEREVRNLRDEVNHLRMRAEDALEQKWQCEKGLAGLKMDLDRAEQETASLRILLQEHDIAVPAELADNALGGDAFAEVIATSSSLESAYQQLQADREEAEASVAHSPNVDDAELAESFNRTDTLAQHVRQQLASNTALRARLAAAINKGEKDQQLSAARINEMQARLKEMEDSLLAAQQHADDEISRHEDEVRQLQESHNAQLLRMKNGSRSPAALSPIIGSGGPNTPFMVKSPRLDKTTSGDGVALTQVVKSEMLDQRVKELEKLLREADREMGEVVSRMNRAQIDVAELQAARDEALRETRRLQQEILTERNVFKNLLGRN
ncbi:hypothetical protein AN1213.2 [Aspergillus nidulans FGSC A4]|uniref:DUF7603 domain-containing protein n=1 Tax=Emericella nidulans (strain FGSC A4 / ATCC 38163 / CBS 112.46 / NRRL 194 / M139) TaxID=227321 RepID=Q5BE17_EMENI|nr:hypothetical protein [Aspergillus nidulans FGSC A4]EAA65806.1 hypothetical protein AN1213.2 [Aspergillus nidulans FGSC A4]CBF87924.1 TPA: conserved hypothetical protein [Aspergillus nidulans FGSC A4]|eukprot:XP_658817.1 hypothetical protein AN1213.2 [Aspergillus nidulans FGSC A4]